MSYFSAVIGRNGSGWRALDIDLEDAESLDEVADTLRPVAERGCVLAVLEHEDEWFALIRVDAEGDPRTFVSDLEATQRGHYAELLAQVGDLELEEYADLRAPAAATEPAEEDLDAEDPDDGVEVDNEEQDPLLAEAERDLAAAAVDPELPPVWAGDPGVLSDVGVDAAELVELVLAAPSDPGAVLAELGESCGFDELIEALR